MGVTASVKAVSDGILMTVFDAPCLITAGVSEPDPTAYETDAKPFSDVTVIETGIRFLGEIVCTNTALPFFSSVIAGFAPIEVKDTVCAGPFIPCAFTA